MPSPHATPDSDRAAIAPRPALVISILILLFALPGCSWEWAHRIYPLPFYESSVTVGGAQDRMQTSQGRIAVLPFVAEQGTNAEREEAIDTLRASFDLALSRLRSYGVVPLADVDGRLAEAGITPDKIPGMNPDTLGRITGAEVLLYCDVKRTRNMTLYVYSHTVYEGTFRLVEASTGDVLWSGRLWEGARGGMFINLFVADIWMEEPKNKDLPAAYRRTADVAVRKLLETIPEPLDETGGSLEKAAEVEGDGGALASGAGGVR
ncbi:MAG: DUF799 family lipoprotein [Deltaproteobacteria bacterium]|nr:DUF799 family lipoprotein [Deltaproteobacteria bacterium]